METFFRRRAFFKSAAAPAASETESIMTIADRESATTTSWNSEHLFPTNSLTYSQKNERPQAGRCMRHKNSASTMRDGRIAHKF
jgi:hypothetical protein